MRLDKFVSIALDVSRAEAKLLIQRKQIKFNDKANAQASVKVGNEDTVKYRGDIIHVIESNYFMVNKPVDVVSATEDATHKTVLSLITAHSHKGLHCVGRLDIDTTGLIFVTNDGKWSHKVTSPKSECEKEYAVLLADPISDDSLAQLAKGIELKNGLKTKPATIERLDERQIVITITEGKYHQVKRMFAAVGNKVKKLHRQRIGTVRLDSTLAPGEYRRLTEAEVQELSA